MSQNHQAFTLIPNLVKIPPIKALSLFNSSTLHGFDHTHQSISFVLHLFLSSEMLSHAQSLLLRLLSGRISSSFFTISSLLNHLTQTHLDFKPHHALLYESIVNTHVQLQLPEQSLFCFIEMIEKGLVPSSNSFNAFLACLLRSNNFEKAWWVFKDMRGRVVMDVYSFGVMIKGCCENGDLNRAFEVLAQLEDLGLCPNVVIYTTLIDGCCKSGDINRAKKLFNEMGELGLVAGQFTYTVLINGFFKKGFKKDGFELWEKMNLDGVSPNIYTYNSIMKSIVMMAK
ncbi:hypothetical protein ACSBR2_004303 [Camellia fascicularis]